MNKITNPYLFPLETGLRLLPDSFHVEVIARVVNHLLKGQSIRDDLEYLEGKHLCVASTDTGNSLTFHLTNGRLRRSPRGRPWDVRISGRLNDFWKLALREEDPDTLFFNRQLSIEGDTDTGLYLKNLLDALDFELDTHLEAVLGKRASRHALGFIERSGLSKRLNRIIHTSS